VNSHKKDQILQNKRIIRSLLKPNRSQNKLNQEELQLLKIIILIFESQNKSSENLLSLIQADSNILAFPTEEKANLAYKYTMESLKQLDRQGLLNKTIYGFSYILTYLFASGFGFAIFNQSVKQMPQMIGFLNDNSNINKTIATIIGSAAIVSNVIFAKAATENYLKQALKKDNFSSLTHVFYLSSLAFMVLNSVAVEAAFPFDAKDEIYQTIFGSDKSKDDLGYKLFNNLGIAQTIASASVLELIYTKFCIEIFRDVSLATISNLPKKIINLVKENKKLTAINTILIGIGSFGFYAFCDNSRDIYRQHFAFLSNDAIRTTSVILAIAGQTPITLVSMTDFGKFACDLLPKNNLQSNNHYQPQLDQDPEQEQQIFKFDKWAKLTISSMTLAIFINSLGGGLLAISDSSSKVTNFFRFLSSFLICFCICGQNLIEEILQKNQIIKSLLQDTSGEDLAQKLKNQQSPKLQLQKPHSITPLTRQNHSLDSIYDTTQNHL
jgi:hypothetical protein